MYSRANLLDSLKKNFKQPLSQKWRYWRCDPNLIVIDQRYILIAKSHVTDVMLLWAPLIDDSKDQIAVIEQDFE